MNAAPGTLLHRLYRPPVVGVLALLVVLLALPLTHSLSLLALNLAGREMSFYFYLPLGVIALVPLVWASIGRTKPMLGQAGAAHQGDG
jgi:hypothetical protein